MSLSYTLQFGRRQGSHLAGVITTLVTHREAEELERIADKLGFTLQEEKETSLAEIPDPEKDIDGAKKELEDIYNLMQAEDQK